MTTSGVYTYSVSRDDIIRLAMLNIGKLDETETPSARETTDCAMFLNLLVKQWQGKADFAPGLKTWTRRHGHLFLSTTTGQYTLGPSGTGWTNSYTGTTLTANAAGSQPAIVLASVTGMLNNDKIGVVLTSGALFWTTVLSIAGLTVTLAANLPSAAKATNNVFYYTTTAQQPVVIETQFLRDINNADTPVRRLILQDYDNLPSKVDTTATADPSAIYFETQLGNSVLYTDCAAAADVTKHLCLTYMEAIQDFVNPTDTPCYPQEWYLPLAWGLSEQIAPMFNAQWTQNMAKNAALSLAIAQKKEPEVLTMYFQCGEDN